MNVGGGGYAGGTLRPMASAWAKESGKDSPRASTPSGCSASGLLQYSATLTLPKDRRALVSLTRYPAEPQSMHVQPWPLANRSTARCWVRERACLRLMLFLFPAPEHPTPLRAALCGWRGHGGDWTEEERTSPRNCPKRGVSNTLTEDL